MIRNQLDTDTHRNMKRLSQNQQLGTLYDFNKDGIEDLFFFYHYSWYTRGRGVEREQAK